MLTVRALNRFALSADTLAGVRLRDCVLFMIQGTKRLLTAIATGEYALVKQPVYKCTPLPMVEQTWPTWQAARVESKVMTVELNEQLKKCGGRDLFNRIHAFLNRKALGISSAEAREQVEGMRKGETVRNVASAGTLSLMRDVQMMLTHYLVKAEMQGNTPCPTEVEEHLAHLFAMRRHIFAEDKALLEHPGSLIKANGAVNPVAHKRVVGSITDGSTPVSVRELATTKSTKQRRLNDAKKDAMPNPFHAFGFKSRSV